MFLPKLKTAPASATNIISLAELRSSLRIGHTDEDALLTRLIEAAVARIDGYWGVIGKALLTQTWQVVVPYLSDPIKLPFGNNATAAVVKYYDTSNDLQTASSDLYSIQEKVGGIEICLKTNQVWPSTYSREDAGLVEWTIGYGAGSDVPAAIKHAVALLASHFYENRAVTDIQSFNGLPSSVQALLHPYSAVPI